MYILYALNEGVKGENAGQIQQDQYKQLQALLLQNYNFHLVSMYLP